MTYNGTYETDFSGRLDAICFESGSENWKEAFSFMGADKALKWSKSYHYCNGWQFLVKINGLWRFAAKYYDEGKNLYKYYISKDEIFSDPHGVIFSQEVSSFIREVDNGYFITR